MVDFLGTPVRVRRGDRVTLDLLMVLEGRATGASPAAVCRKYGYRSVRSYHRKRSLFDRCGTAGLVPRRTGPKQPSRRTRSAERRVVALRVRRPDLSAAAIAERLRAAGFS
ncbi:MAG: hypothetical protein HY906_08680, partial [Deltaproteobacteria bacterium]|nr:hypothetical protein [Deltaproteobacteria bacterium]